MKLEGKVCVVTGASMGIGEAIAHLFVSEGATVVLSSRDLHRVQDACARIAVPERTYACECDVRVEAQLQALLVSTVERYGRVDIWVNNAGFGLVDSVEQMDLELCRQMFDTNLFAAIRAMQIVIPQMKRQGGGTIINISSVAGSIAVPYMAAYGATKHALNCITKAARLESRNSGVKIVSVEPGYVSTEFSSRSIRGRDNRGVPASVKLGIPPQRVAAAVLKACDGNRREIVVPWRGNVLIALYRLMPGAFEWAMMRTMKKN
jgi:short-subunit dehydrogenase